MGPTEERATKDPNYPKAIYLDTNALVQSNWPKPSKPFLGFMKLAHELRIAIFLPEPVEREAEQHWIRGLEEAVAKSECAVREYKRLASCVNGRVNVDRESLEDLLRRYRENSTAAKKDFGVQTIPMARRPTNEFFDLAIRYELPFERNQKGKGFQDAVILSSVLEHVETQEDFRAILVTTDRKLSQVAIARFSPSHVGPDVTFRTFDETFELLFDMHIKENLVKPWKREESEAKLSVEAALPDLKRFLLWNLSASMLTTDPLDTVVEIRGIDSLDVAYLRVPIPSSNSPERQRRFDIAVKAICRVLVERNHTALESLPVTSSAPPPDRHEERLLWIGGVEAIADVKDREYTDLKFLSFIPAEDLFVRK